MDRLRPAGCVPHTLDSVLLSDARPGRVSVVILALRTHGAAHSAGDRQPGAALEAASAFPRQRIPAFRRRRSDWSGGNGAHPGFLHWTEHGAALLRREDPEVSLANLRNARAITNREGHDFSGCGKTQFAAALKGRDFQSRRKSPIKGAAASAAERTQHNRWSPTLLRWLKFNAVGALGIGVQLIMLFVLNRGFHLSYLPATALALEAALMHNFFWHERYTWADRVRPSWHESLPRLLRFNLTTGGVSIAGNLALMRVLVGLGHVNYLLANGVAIALCSLANFLVSEEWVFRT